MKFRKKPVVIDAVQFNGENVGEIREFEGLGKNQESTIAYSSATRQLKIVTLEGTMTADSGDWLIKGVGGEFYPCKPYFFEQCYEAIIDG